jgi:hypothetical protein
MIPVGAAHEAFDEDGNLRNARTDGACGNTLQGAVTSSIINDTGIISFDGKSNLTIKLRHRHSVESAH